MQDHYYYQFPPNRRAAGCTIIEQAHKVLEEAIEALVATVSGEIAIRVCEEHLDTIVAAENELRKYPAHTVDAAYALVLDKNAQRGDWSNHNAK